MPIRWKIGLGALVLAGIGAVLVAVDDSPGFARGTSLAIPNAGGKELRDQPPGQELVLAGVVTLRNMSRTALTIKRIEPIEPLPESAPIEIVSLELTPQGEEPVTPSTYLTFPPVERKGGGCKVQELQQVRGYELTPSSSEGDTADVVVRLRALEPALAEVMLARVFYEQDGKVYFQDLQYTIRIPIREGAHGYRRPSSVERPCITPDIEVLGVSSR